MIYAGIGARATPPEWCAYMEQMGEYLARAGHVLRSGNALGADRAFEAGCDRASGAKEIYTVNNMTNEQTTRWLPHAKLFHPNWAALKGIYWYLLMARNSPIILGPMLDKPVDFVICYTADGKTSGGTGQALRIVETYQRGGWNIPIFNLFHGHQPLADWLAARGSI